MASFNFVRDEERNQAIAQFNAKLISCSEAPVGAFPSGKEYHVGTIEFENSKGQKVQRSTIINKANFDKGMSEGNVYLCSAIVKDGQDTVLIVCSHLQSSSVRADMDDFGVDVANTTRVINGDPLIIA